MDIDENKKPMSINKTTDVDLTKMMMQDRLLHKKVQENHQMAAGVGWLSLPVL